MPSEENNEPRPGIVQGIDDRAVQKSRKAVNPTSHSAIVDGLDERIRRKSQTGANTPNAPAHLQASNRSMTMQGHELDDRIMRKSQMNLKTPSSALTSTRSVAMKGNDQDDRILRKSQMNLTATSSAQPSTRSMAMQRREQDDRIMRKSQMNLAATSSSQPSTRSMMMPVSDQRIMNKSRQGLTEHSESRRIRRNQVTANAEEKTSEISDKDKNLERKRSAEFNLPPLPNRNTSAVNVRFDNSTKMPKSEKDMEHGKFQSNKIPERVLPKTSSTASMFLSFHRIKRKKKKEKEVDSNEILKADFAFVDTYENHESNKMKLLEEKDEDLESTIQTDASLVHLCRDFFRGTGFVGLLIMAALVCSIVIPISKAREKSIMMKDFPTMHPTSQPTSSEYIPVFNVIRQVTSEQTLHDEDSPQYHAFNWIVNEDPVRMSHQDPALLQRYALAVLYYANSGSRWYQKEGWLTGDDVCEWDHVTCGAADIVTGEGIVTDLDFYNLGLSGTLPSEIGELVALRSLILAGNKLSGTIPTELYKLDRLENLLLNRNKFEGTLSEDVKKFEDIKILAVSENNLHGTIPESIGQCSKLKEIYLHSNKFTGKIPAHLSKLTNLELLDMAKNSFSGTLPRDMMNFARLAFLELSFNKLSGSIPTQFGSLKTLRRLKMSYNQITGTLPTQLGHLNDLIHVSLESNLGLHGQIPTEIGNLSKLISIDFGQCSFSGTLPTELGKLSSLVYLNLYDNDISGTIPTEMGKMINLKESRLQFTKLEGEVPNQFCALRSQSLLLLQADCQDRILCDEKCCTRCTMPN